MFLDPNKNKVTGILAQNPSNMSDLIGLFNGSNLNKIFPMEEQAVIDEQFQQKLELLLQQIIEFKKRKDKKEAKHCYQKDVEH